LQAAPNKDAILGEKTVKGEIETSAARTVGVESQLKKKLLQDYQYPVEQVLGKASAPHLVCASDSAMNKSAVTFRLISLLRELLFDRTTSDLFRTVI